jgi:hypothetical protein
MGIVPQPDRLLGMYLHLARASEMRRQPMVRDKLLVLAGVTAAEMGLAEISAECRERVLSSNHWHLVRNWPTLGEALDDERFQVYFKQLSRRYSPEKAEYLLGRLGIDMARERDAYFTDHEYAAALLGVHRPQAATAPVKAKVAASISIPTTLTRVRAPQRRWRLRQVKLGWSPRNSRLKVLWVVLLVVAPPVLIGAVLALLVLLLQAAPR